MAETFDGEAVAAEIRRGIAPGQRIAFVSGNFNVVHPGHLRLLRFAADNGDVLVVGLLPDTADGATVPAALRLEGLHSIAMVQHAFVLGEPRETFIKRLKPDIVVKGKEYETRHNVEQAAVDSYGGKLLFSSGEVRFSSIGLLQREYFETNFSAIRKPRDFPKRHAFEVSELKSVLPRFSGLRVLVVGDLIVDTYINCDPLGMSQEDPTIVVTPIEDKTFIGGAAIVAAHARGLGAEVRFITVAGGDERAAFSREQLAWHGVEAEVLLDPTRPTTWKQRYRASGKTLLRVNHLRQHAIGADLAQRMLDAIDAVLPSVDLLLFSDFNYGCLPQPLVAAIAERAGGRGIMMAADSQASSQFSDISRFKNMRLITPTEREARLAMQDFDSGLIVLAEKLRDQARAENVVITLAAEGLLVFTGHEEGAREDRLPAFNSAPKDVAGAGDSFFCCTSLALCAGTDIWRSAYLGSLAAACQVSRVGNTPLELGDLITEIDLSAS
jgi:rfaE bifunctional protein kinase chain/domain